MKSQSNFGTNWSGLFTANSFSWKQRTLCTHSVQWRERENEKEAITVTRLPSFIKNTCTSIQYFIVHFPCTYHKCTVVVAIILTGCINRNVLFVDIDPMASRRVRPTRKRTNHSVFWCCVRWLLCMCSKVIFFMTNIYVHTSLMCKWRKNMIKPILNGKWMKWKKNTRFSQIKSKYRISKQMNGIYLSYWFENKAQISNLSIFFLSSFPIQPYACCSLFE